SSHPHWRALAWYIATSARWISAWASSPWSGKRAMPTLACTVREMPSTTNGSSSAERNRCATSPGSSNVRTANSSPPIRASGSALARAEAQRHIGLEQRAEVALALLLGGVPVGDGGVRVAAERLLEVVLHLELAPDRRVVVRVDDLARLAPDLQPRDPVL